MLKPPVQTVRVSSASKQRLIALSKKIGSNPCTIARWGFCYSLVLPGIPIPACGAPDWVHDSSDLILSWDEFRGDQAECLILLFRHWLHQNNRLKVPEGLMGDLFHAHLERGIEVISKSPSISDAQSFVDHVIYRIDVAMDQLEQGLDDLHEEYIRAIDQAKTSFPGIEEWLDEAIKLIDPDLELAQHYRSIKTALADIKIRSLTKMDKAFSQTTLKMMKAMLTLMDANPMVVVALLELTDSIHERHLQYMAGPIVVGDTQGRRSISKKATPSWEWLRKAALSERLDRIYEEWNEGIVGNLATPAEVACYLAVMGQSDMALHLTEEWMDVWFWANAQTMVNHPDISPMKFGSYEECWHHWDKSLKGSGVTQGQRFIQYEDIKEPFEQLAADIRRSVVQAAAKDGIRSSNSESRNKRNGKNVKKTAPVNGDQATDALSDSKLLEMFNLPESRMDPNAVLRGGAQAEPPRTIHLPAIKLNKSSTSFNPTAGAGSLKGSSPESEEPKILQAKPIKPRRALGFGGDRKTLNVSAERRRLSSGNDQDPKQLPPAPN